MDFSNVSITKNIIIPISETTANNSLNIPELLKYILYINLDGRPDRLKHVLSEMDKCRL